MRFEQLNLDVLDLLTTDQPARALQAADQALALWRGDPFAHLVDRTWAIGPVARLAEIRTQLHEHRVDAILSVGRHEQAVAELKRLLAEHPFRERLWWQQMLALYRCGRTEDALTTYQTARRTLLDEVGLEPGAELVDLQRRILAQDPTLQPSSPAPIAACSGQPPRVARQVELRLPRPRPMLGRGRDLHAVRELLQRSSVVTITGAAGCGKTLLATETARIEAPGFADGVRFVDLSAVEDDADVAEQVAAALDLAVPPGADPLTTLVQYATDRRALLVLDNCEQLLDQVGELDHAERLRDEWGHALVLGRPPAGRPEEADWYEAIELDLATARATLHRRLITAPDRLGIEMVGQLPGFWYYLDMVEEGIRWTEAAAQAADGADLIGVTVRLTLANLLAVQNRADRSRALVLESLQLISAPTGDGLRLADEPAPLAATEQRWLLELLLSVASTMSVVRDVDAMDRLLRLVEATGRLDDDLDLELVHAVLTFLAEMVSRPDRAALERAEDLFRRADEQANLWAAWMAASTGAMIALAHRDPELGLRWSRRVVDRQRRLGAKTVISQVETYGDFLALDGQLVRAVRIFAATHQQSRRVGRDWPRNPLTTEMLDRCRACLSAEEFAGAWALGPTLDRDQLTR